MSDHLPPLSALRAFEAAARHRNFTRAGEELGMTQSAVSYQIRLLEERIGSPLFVRHARNVSLSEVGTRLAPGLIEAFDLIRTTVASAHESARQTLNITVLQTFASHWLATHIGRFHLAHPDIALRLDASTALVDFSQGEFDLGIRTGRGNWEGLEAHRLMPFDFTLMAVPELAAKLKEPADIGKLPLVNPADDWWEIWLRAAGLDPEIAKRGPQLLVDSQATVASMALAGEGLALLTPILFRRELDRGLLVQPFDIVCEIDYGYWLVYPKSRRNSPPVRAFREWILDEFSETAPPADSPQLSIME